MRRLLAFGVLALSPIGLMGACGSNALVGKGGACFQTIDCQLGLVCITVNDAGTCTNDLTGIVTLPEAGSDTAQLDVTPNDAVTDQVVQDTFVQDTGKDTSTQDTGTDSSGGQDAGDSG